MKYTLFILSYCHACTELSIEEFRTMNVREHATNPFIVRGIVKDWAALSKWATPESFTDRFRSFQINPNRSRFARFTHNDAVGIPEYMSNMQKDHIIVMDDNQRTDPEYDLLEAVKQDFWIPSPFHELTYARVLSLGGGEGVEFMKHCAAWIGLVTGVKRWHFASPDSVNFNGNTRPCEASYLKQEEESICTMYPGDAVYVPDMWWHATCNLKGYTIGVGTQCWDNTKTQDHSWKVKDEL